MNSSSAACSSYNLLQNWCVNTAPAGLQRHFVTICYNSDEYNASGLVKRSIPEFVTKPLQKP